MTTTASLPAPPRNLLLRIEYDGAGYVGWERQKNGAGIQAVIEDAVRSITKETVVLNGTGRTDTGVHAEGQHASFVLEHRIDVADLNRALNAVLPDDIAILSVREVPLTFHARFSALAKLYRYRILNSPMRSPLRRGHALHVRHALDVDRMSRAAFHLVGRHDFRSFCKEPDRNRSCVRNLERLDVVKCDDTIELRLRGEGFLYNMVRIIAGTLIQVGSGRRDPDDIVDIREDRDRTRAGPTAAAHGLCLVEVFFRPRDLELVPIAVIKSSAAPAATESL